MKFFKLALALSFSTLAVACGGSPDDEFAGSEELSSTDDALLYTGITKFCSGTRNLRIENLRITNAQNQDTTCWAGDVTWVKFNVRNAGSCSVPATKLYVEGYYDNFGFIDIPALSANSSPQAIWINWAPSYPYSGHYKVIHADHTALVAESNEIDNSAAFGCN